MRPADLGRARPLHLWEKRTFQGIMLGELLFCKKVVIAVFQ